MAIRNKASLVSSYLNLQMLPRVSVGVSAVGETQLPVCRPREPESGALLWAAAAAGLQALCPRPEGKFVCAIVIKVEGHRTFFTCLLLFW